jgi:nicotinamidase-related amidase
MMKIDTRHWKNGTRRLSFAVKGNPQGAIMSLFHKSQERPDLARDAIVLFADLQEGIADLPLTVPPDRLRASVKALAQLARIFSLPAIVSTVPGRDGGPAKVMPVIGEVLGNVEAFQRTTPASFANDAIVRAAAATGRRTVLVSGVATEVAVQFACLSALEHGYAVHLIADACGGISVRTEDAAFRRLTAAGVTISSVPALAGELAGDFTQAQGQAAIGVLFEMAIG